MARGLRSLCILAVCLAAGAHTAEAASAHGRKILQTTAPPGGACGAAANARCPNGQCCSQWGWCGVSSGHCGTGCQALYSASNSACAGSGTTAPAPPPVTTNPVAPPPPPATGCVDTYAACPAWGPSSCIFGGVPQLCPCMCGGGGTTAPAPPAAQPPAPAPQPQPQPGGGSVSSLISEQQWETIFANRNNGGCQGAATNFYNYGAFITAAASFPAFATSSDSTTNKRELAAFLAQISHETTGGWATAPGGPYSWGLCFINEGGFTPQTAPYCAASAEYPCAPGKTYIGRGPMQLSWNYNYIQAGRALGFDGLNNPEVVATDPVIAFKTAIWFWMTPQSPKPSCNAVMTGRFTPTSADTAARRVAGFGLTTNIINGGIECGKGTITAQQADRIGFYRRYAEIMGVSVGDNLDCANQSSY